MTTAVAFVGRKKSNFKRNRIEMIAEPEWIAAADAEAKRWGLSLSAYIRLAVNEKMVKDKDAFRQMPRGR